MRQVVPLRLAVVALFLMAAISELSAAMPGMISRVADRAAIERVYYEHWLGTKPAFEQALPRAQIERMVKLDFKKEAVLKRAYRTEIAPSELETEVQRINSTTRAPQTLAEVKAALNHDPARFAETVARPLVVDRKLRAQFDNDAKLHATERVQAEQIRKKVLAVNEPETRISLLKQNEAVNFHELTWQLTARPDSPAAPLPATAPVKVAQHSADYSIEATAQVSPVINNTAARTNRPYFEDIDPELQKILRAQLRKAGDVSAVVETATAFLVFVSKEITADTLSVASVTIPKRSYDEWLAQQSD